MERLPKRMQRQEEGNAIGGQDSKDSGGIQKKSPPRWLPSSPPQRPAFSGSGDEVSFRVEEGEYQNQGKDKLLVSIINKYMGHGDVEFGQIYEQPGCS